MRFSVIIPVYKVEKYLNECVESVLAQDFKDYEIVLVDDGSPDRCPILCDEYAKDYNHISVIHKINGGLSDARNFGIKAAKGDYILFLDSDDYWDRKDVFSKIDWQISHTGNPEVLMFQGKKYYSDSGKCMDDVKFDVDYINTHTKDDVIKNIIETQSYSMSACGKVTKRETIVSKKLYFQKGLIGEDLDWFLNLVTSVDTIKAIDLCCYVYRIREGSITTTAGEKSLKHQLYIIHKWHKLLKERVNDECYQKYYLGILAYAYMVAMLHYSSADHEVKERYYPIMKQEADILNYAVNKKTKLTATVSRLIGIRATSFLLRSYYSWRNG